MFPPLLPRVFRVSTILLPLRFHASYSPLTRLLLASYSLLTRPDTRNGRMSELGFNIRHVVSQFSGDLRVPHRYCLLLASYSLLTRLLASYSVYQGVLPDKTVSLGHGFDCHPLKLDCLVATSVVYEADGFTVHEQSPDARMLGMGNPSIKRSSYG
eukprot:4481739-Pyramimonas_sp.AAC.1